jgi:hypothetical protein
MEPDQPFYDTLFRMAGAYIFFAREAREARERCQELAVRALTVEARARCLEFERDYWKARDEHRVRVRQSWERRRKAA